VASLNDERALEILERGHFGVARADPGRWFSRLQAEEGLLVAVAGRLVAQPLTIATVGEHTDLVVREADEVALAHEPFVSLKVVGDVKQGVGLAGLRRVRAGLQVM
jgi:hypothetical protein